jgi:hypothetical protein
VQGMEDLRAPLGCWWNALCENQLKLVKEGLQEVHVFPKTCWLARERNSPFPSQETSVGAREPPLVPKKSLPSGNKKSYKTRCPTWFSGQQAAGAIACPHAAFPFSSRQTLTFAAFDFLLSSETRIFTTWKSQHITRSSMWKELM